MSVTPASDIDNVQCATISTHVSGLQEWLCEGCSCIDKPDCLQNGRRAYSQVWQISLLASFYHGFDRI